MICFSCTWLFTPLNFADTFGWLPYLRMTLKNIMPTIINIWKTYMKTASWRIKWKKIIAVIDVTFAVAKRKPAKKIQACKGLLNFRRPAPSWLVSSIGRALHRHRKGQGFESRTSLNFFQALFSQLQKLRPITAMICFHLLMTTSRKIETLFKDRETQNHTLSRRKHRSRQCKGGTSGSLLYDKCNHHIWSQQGYEL